MEARKRRRSSARQAPTKIPPERPKKGLKSDTLNSKATDYPSEINDISLSSSQMYDNNSTYRANSKNQFSIDSKDDYAIKTSKNGERIYPSKFSYISAYNDEVSKLKSDLELEKMVNIQQSAMISDMRNSNKLNQNHKKPNQQLTQIKQNSQQNATQSEIISQQIINHLETKINTMISQGAIPEDDKTVELIHNMRTELETTQIKLDDAESIQNQQELTIDTLNATIERKNDQINELTSQIKSVDQTRIKLEESLQTLNDTFNKANEELNNRINVLEKDLLTKNNQIFDLKKSLQNTELLLNTTQSKLNESEAKNEELMQQVDSYRSKVKSLQSVINDSSKDQTVEKLKRQITLLTKQLANNAEQLENAQANFEQRIADVEAEKAEAIEELQLRIEELQISPKDKNTDSDLIKAKDAQIQSLEEERRHLIQRIGEEIRTRDEKIDELSRQGPSIVSSKLVSSSQIFNESFADKSGQNMIQKLQKQIDRLKDEIARKDERASKQDACVQQLQNELRNAQDELKTLKSSNQEKEGQISILQNSQKNSRLEKEMLNLKSKYDNLQDSYDKLSADFKSTCERYEKDIDSKAAEIKSLQNALQTKTNEIENLTDSLAVLSAEKEAISQSSSKDITILKQKLEKLTETESKLLMAIETAKIKFGVSEIKPTAAVEKFCSIFENISKSNQNERLERISFQQQMAADIRKAADSEAERIKEVESLRSQLEERETEIFELTQSLQKSVDITEMQDNLRQQKRLEDALTLKERENIHLSQRITEMENSYSEQVEEIKKQLKEHESIYTEQINKAVSKIEKKKSIIDSLKVELARAKHENESLKMEANERIEDSAKLIESMKLQLQKQKVELQQFQSDSDKASKANTELIDELRSTISRIEIEKNKISQQQSAQQIEAERYISRSRKLEQKILTLSQTIKEKESMITELQSSLESTAISGQESMQGIVSQLERRTKQLKEAEMKIDELSESVETSNQNAQKVKEQYEGKVTSFEKRVKKLESMVKKLKDFATGLQEEKVQLEQKCMDYRQAAKAQKKLAKEAEQNASRMIEAKNSNEIVFLKLADKHKKLQESFTAADEERIRLAALVEDAEKRSKDAQIEKENLISEIEKLKSVIQSKEEDVKKTEEKLQIISQVVDNNRTETQRIAGERDRVSEETMSLRNKIQELQDTIASYKNMVDASQLDELKEKLQRIEIEKENIETVKVKLEQEKEEAIKNFEQCQNENQILNQKIEGLENQLSDAKKVIENKENEFEKRLERRTNEIQDNRNDINAKVKALSESKETIAKLREEISMTKIQNNYAMEKITIKLRETEDENQKLRKDLDTAQKAITKAESDKALIEGQLSEKTRISQESAAALEQARVAFDEQRNEMQEALLSARNDAENAKAEKEAIVELMKKEKKKSQQTKAVLEKAVDIDEFTKLQKKYLAAKNALALSEKKILNSAVENGKLREEQLEKFRQREAEWHAEANSLRDQIESKKELIRKLQQQIKQDGIKLEVFTEAPMIPRDEYNAVKNQLKTTEDQLTATQAELDHNKEVLVQMRERIDAMDQQNGSDKEKTDVLLNGLQKRINSLTALSTKVTAAHGILTNASYKELDMSKALTVAIDAINECFDTIGLERLPKIKEAPVLEFWHKEGVLIESTFHEDNEKVFSIIEDIKHIMLELPTALSNSGIASMPNSDSGIESELMFIRSLSQQAKSQFEERESMIERMQKLISSQKNVFELLNNASG